MARECNPKESQNRYLYMAQYLQLKELKELKELGNDTYKPSFTKKVLIWQSLVEGWESDTNTWEPKEHLEDCPEKLEDFEKKWKRKQEGYETNIIQTYLSKSFLFLKA